MLQIVQACHCASAFLSCCCVVLPAPGAITTYDSRCKGSLFVRVPSMSNSTPLIWLRSGTGLAGLAMACCPLLLLLLEARTHARDALCWLSNLFTLNLQEDVAALAALCMTKEHQPAKLLQSVTYLLGGVSGRVCRSDTWTLGWPAWSGVRLLAPE